MDTEKTADSLPQASDAEIFELIGAPSAANPKPAEGQASPPRSQPSEQAPQPSTPQSQPSASPLSRVKPTEARDYTGLTEEEIARFKKMGNDTFEWLLPIYRKYKEGQPPEDVQKKLAEYEAKLKEAEDRRWFDHPESYRLTDEYNQLQASVNEANAVASHWQQQLVAVDGGAKEIQMLQYDQAGNLVTVKTPVTPATRADLINRMNLAAQDIQQVNQELSGLKEAHGKRYGGFRTALDGIYDKHFKPHEKLLESHVKTIIEGFPAWFRNRPEARLLAASLASNEVLTAHYEGQKNAEGSRQLFSQAAQASGPSKETLETGTNRQAQGASGKKVVRMPTPEEEKAFNARFL